MPVLAPAQWAALRAEYEATAASLRDLGRRYGVSDTAIRARVRDEVWERDPAAAERTRERAAILLVDVPSRVERGEVAVRPPGPAEMPSPGARPRQGHEPRTTVANPASSHPQKFAPRVAPVGCGNEEISETLRALALEQAAEALAAAARGQLRRTAALIDAYERIARLIPVALQPVDQDHDPEGYRRQTLALQTLMAGGNSASLSAILTSWVRLGESIQTQQRRALGADDRPRRVEMSGPGGRPIPSATATTLPSVGFANMDTAQLEILMQAAEIMQGVKKRPPVPMPPQDPAALRAAAQAAEAAGEEVAYGSEEELDIMAGA